MIKYLKPRHRDGFTASIEADQNVNDLFTCSKSFVVIYNMNKSW